MSRFQVSDGGQGLDFSHLWIRTKERQLIPFDPNPVQRLYLDAILPAWRSAPVGLEGRRELILKARQFGFSTLILALLFLDTITRPNTQSVIIAHDGESTERLFQQIHRYYTHLPDELRPRTKYSNRRELAFTDLDSYLFVGTAGAGEFGRGGTINNVHGSEVAFWPDAENIVAGLLEAVPRSGNVFLESTANGVGGWYHDEYQASKLGDSVYSGRFYGWNQHPEYRVDPPAGWTRTAEEQILAARWGLDDGQLAWRRDKKRALRWKFPQEYPLHDGEAFLSTGGRILSEVVWDEAPRGVLVPDFVPPRSWRHLLIIDPGWQTTAGLWAAIDPAGVVWLYGEHYVGAAEKAGGQGWRPEQHMRALHVQWRIYGQPDVRVWMDPAGFDVKRTTTGRENPSDAAEFEEAARKLGAEWFRPMPADNADPLAYRVKRYVAANRVRACRSLKCLRWEAERWVRQAERTGRYAHEQPVPEAPIRRNDHLMACLRYLFNLLPDLVHPDDDPPMTALEAHWARLREDPRPDHV